MTSYSNETENKEAFVVIKKEAQPAPVPEEFRDMQKKATVGWKRKIGEAIQVLKGEYGEDISRLREGGVSCVEAENLKKIADAKKTEAEAAKIHAEKERIQNEAALIQMEVVAQALGLTKRISDMEVSDAKDRLIEAVLQILEKNGDVAFELDQDGSMKTEKDG